MLRQPIVQRLPHKRCCGSRVAVRCHTIERPRCCDVTRQDACAVCPRTSTPGSDCLGDPQQPPPPRVQDDGSKHEECCDAREDEGHPEVPLQPTKPHSHVNPAWSCWHLPMKPQSQIRTACEAHRACVWPASSTCCIEPLRPAAAHLAGAGALLRHPGVVVHAKAAHHHGHEAEGQHDGVDDQRQPAGFQDLDTQCSPLGCQVAAAAPVLCLRPASRQQSQPSIPMSPAALTGCCQTVQESS